MKPFWTNAVITVAVLMLAVAGFMYIMSPYPAEATAGWGCYNPNSTNGGNTGIRSLDARTKLVWGRGQGITPLVLQIPPRPRGLSDTDWAVKQANAAYVVALHFGAIGMPLGRYYPGVPKNHNKCKGPVGECYFCLDCTGHKTCGDVN